MYFPKEVEEALSKEATRQNLYATEIVRAAVREWLAKRGHRVAPDRTPEENAILQGIRNFVNQFNDERARRLIRSIEIQFGLDEGTLSKLIE